VDTTRARFAWALRKAWASRSAPADGGDGGLDGGRGAPPARTRGARKSHRVERSRSHHAKDVDAAHVIYTRCTRHRAARHGHDEARSPVGLRIPPSDQPESRNLCHQSPSLRRRLVCRSVDAAEPRVDVHGPLAGGARRRWTDSGAVSHRHRHASKHPLRRRLSDSRPT
jgi:hypothetical protein